MDTKNKIIYSHIDHYSNVSNDYNSNYNIGNNSYEKWILLIIIKELNIDQNSIIADVGGGNGLFSKQIFDEVQLNSPVLCVDSSYEMIKNAERFKGVIPECLDALQFAELYKTKKERFNGILLKEMIHHIPRNKIQTLFTELKDLITTNGIILTITRPNKVSYPLFKEAHKVWFEQQPSKEDLLTCMKNAGLNVMCRSIFFDISMTKEQWFHIIKSRFWSTFSHFSDDELDEGINEIKIMLADQANIEMTEELILFIATK